MALAVATVLSASICVAVSSAAQAATWVPTATKALRLTAATPLGSAPAVTPLRLTIGLAPQDRAGLDALIKAQSTPGTAQYEHYLTPAQFAAEFAPSAAAVSQVAQYLSTSGLSNVQTPPTVCR